MDWIKNLPLEEMSEQLAELIVWWAKLVEGVPDNDLPLVVYVIASVLVILLWLLVIRILPKAIGGVSWLFLTAVLLAPGHASGDSGELAPALIGVFHKILMKDFAGAVTASLPILATFAALLFIGAIWKFLCSVIESDVAKAEETQAIQAEKQRLAQLEADVQNTANPS